MVQAASANVNKLQHAVVRMEKTDSKRLQDEYKNLVEGLSSSFGGMGDRDLGGGGGGGGASAASSSARGDSAAETDMLLASPVLPSDLLRESVPGNIRRANHFLMFLRSWVEFLRRQLRQPQVSQKSTEAFLEELRVDTKISDLRAMKFAYDRLQSLYKTLQITDMDDFNPLTAVVNLATMAAMYKEGFTIIFEPFDEVRHAATGNTLAHTSARVPRVSDLCPVACSPAFVVRSSFNSSFGLAPLLAFAFSPPSPTRLSARRLSPTRSSSCAASRRATPSSRCSSAFAASSSPAARSARSTYTRRCLRFGPSSQRASPCRCRGVSREHAEEGRGAHCDRERPLGSGHGASWNVCVCSHSLFSFSFDLSLSLLLCACVPQTASVR